MSRRSEKLKATFGCERPIIGMLHLLGHTPEQVIEIARSEARILYDAGVAAVLVEDYFGGEEDVVRTLAMLKREFSDHVYGVNLLGQFTESYELALRYGARFMQVDSICGHLSPEADRFYELEINEARDLGDLFVLGGVRFKYQPVKSMRTLEEDLRIGASRCDAVVVTGTGTGVNTDMAKICEFRRIIGDYPLIVGAGMTATTCASQLAVADGGIVGTYFKCCGETRARMDPARVKKFMRAVISSRA